MKNSGQCLLNQVDFVLSTYNLLKIPDSVWKIGCSYGADLNVK